MLIDLRMAALPLACSILAMTPALAPAQSSTTPIAIPAEHEVIARRGLMLAIDNAMYELEEAAADPSDRDAFLIALRASDAAAMLRATALLFPPESNFAELGQPDDPAAATYAGGSIWDDFAAFYADMSAAAALADEAALAPDIQAMAPLIADLREVCSSCHTQHVTY